MSDSNHKDTTASPKPVSPARSTFKKIVRVLENIVFWLISIVVVLYFVLQLPFVQNWLISKVTAYLSEELRTEVSIQHVDIEFFDKIVLDGLYVADEHGDTLLYAGQVSAGLHSNFFTLLDNRADFDEISLSHARINIRRAEGEYYNNLRFLLDSPFFKGSGSKNKNKTPFPFSIRNVNLLDVVFLSDDHVRGRRMRYTLPSGNIKVNTLDLVSNIYDIESINLHGFWFDMDDFPSRDLPPNPNAVKTSLPDTSKQNIKRLPVNFHIHHFVLDDGRFNMDRYHISAAKETIDNVMDYNHMSVSEIRIEADSVSFTDDLTFRGRLHDLSAKEQSGFQVLGCKADKVEVNDTLTSLFGARLNTAASSLGDTIQLHYKKYNDYLHFTSAVDLDIHLSENSKLRLGDIMYFKEVVNNNQFFINNKETVADVSGWVHGIVGEKLKGEHLKVKINDNTFMQGDFRGDGLSGAADQRVIEVKFEQLQSDITTISKIVPGFSAPKYFYNLGRIGFKGDYQLFYGFSHILHGDIKTDVGYGDVDMSLDLKEGKEKATYSGYLNMHDFDMATWTGDNNFGLADFKFNIDEGSSGLTLSTIKAKLSGQIDTLYYRGYPYRHVEADGYLREKVFDGKLAMKDPNIDFSFDGKIDLNSQIPRLIFQADIKRLDLGALHLMDQDWVLSGMVEKMDLNAKDWNDLTGTVMLRNFNILQDREKFHHIDSLRFVTDYRPDGTRFFNLNSDVMDAQLEGEFNILKVPLRLEQLFSRYHPLLAAKLGFNPPDSLPMTDHYEMRIQINNTKDLTQLFDPSLDTLKEIYIKGRVEGESGMSQLLIEAGQPIKYGGFTFRDVGLTWFGLRDSASFNLRIPETDLPRNKSLDSIRIGGLLAGEELTFSLEAKDSASIVEKVNLNGALTTVDSLWEVRFNSSHIALFNEEWLMADNNYFRFGNGRIETKDFELFHDNQRITLDSFNNGKGLFLSFANFNLDLINKVVNNKNMEVRGKMYDFDVKVEDLFALKGIHAFINTDTVFINKVAYGEVNGNIDLEDMDAPVSGKIFLRQNDITVLRIAGAYLPGGEVSREVPDLGITVRPKQFLADVSASGFPLNVLETFVPGISNTKGLFDAEVQLSGPFSRLGMKGYTIIRNGQFEIDYLKTPFYVRNQRIELSDYRIWTTKDTVWDASQTRNMAIIDGGLEHDHFKNWALNCTIESTNFNFMMLNTRPQDNDLFYGQGIGKFTARFGGTFVRTNIYIDATTGKDTRLYIPLSAAADVKDASFIKFVNKNEPPATIPKKSTIITEAKGLNLEMNLTVTDDAEIQLIFDEQAGDIIKGRGEGDLKLIITREGEFLMYGSYRILRGEYLFTLLNFVNKPFTVAEGGTINWYGDPYGAQINLDATYDETTSLYNLLRDEVALFEGTLANEARQATQVRVTMHMKGELFKPSISFDLEFPRVSNQLKSFTDNKLRLMKQDPNEITRQVFGLVVMGQFLPSNAGGSLGQGSDYLGSAIHSVTQVLSNQLSNYLTDLAGIWFKKGTITSIDFDIAYNDYQNKITQTNKTEIGRELQIRMSSGLFNDRVTVQFGSNFGLGQPGTTVQDGFLGEDLVIEIQMTENKNWRMKMYQRTEPDYGGGRRRSRLGFGISFRKEYDSFEDLIEGAKSLLRGRKI